MLHMGDVFSKGEGPILVGRNVLVVEDESIVSLLLEDMLLELGCASVWLAANVAEALKMVADKPLDVAVLDVNLGREAVYPVAERLDAIRVPFLFATGYGRAGVDARWLDHPVIQKPYDADVLAQSLRSLFRG
jgi:CheY-like chemotaxis protein